MDNKNRNWSVCSRLMICVDIELCTKKNRNCLSSYFMLNSLFFYNSLNSFRQTNDSSWYRVSKYQLTANQTASLYQLALIHLIYLRNYFFPSFMWPVSWQLRVVLHAFSCSVISWRVMKCYFKFINFSNYTELEIP